MGVVENFPNYARDRTYAIPCNNNMYGIGGY